MVWSSKFFISDKAKTRIREFLSSYNFSEPKQDISNYWQKKYDEFDYLFIEGGIRVCEDSLSSSRIYNNRLSLKQYSRLRRKVLSGAGRIARSVPFLSFMQGAVARGLIEPERRDLYRLMLTDKRRAYFPFGLWGKEPNPLNERPYVDIIKSWPLRALHTFRTMDVLERLKKLSQTKNASVIEIGAGPAILSGTMAHRFGTRHVLIELPERIVLGFSFLSEFFPEKKVLLPNEIDMKDFNANRADVLMMTPKQTDILKDASFDVGVNMWSFQEMPYKAIEDYFLLLKRCLKQDGIFYCLNRLSKFLKADNRATEFAKYPWSKNDEVLHDLVFDGMVDGIKVNPMKYREKAARLRG